MKLLFLHGLGQNSRAWDQVRTGLPDQDCQALDLFDGQILPKDLSVLQAQVVKAIEECGQEVVLVGLSLGGMLALSLLERDLPQVKGLVVIAGQYKMKDNWAYKLQLRIFSLFPRWLFKKQGMDKDNLLVFYRNLAEFDLTEQLRACQKPVLLLCGDKDKINHKASLELVDLLKHGRFEIISGSGHEMTKDQPTLLAEAISRFLKEI